MFSATVFIQIKTDEVKEERNISSNWLSISLPTPMGDMYLCTVYVKVNILLDYRKPKQQKCTLGVN